MKKLFSLFAMLCGLCMVSLPSEATTLAVTRNSSSGISDANYTITVNTPGTFGNILLSTIEQWSDIEELTVIGHLNEDDMKMLTRLKLATKIDLSQTDITFITGCNGLTLLREILLPSTVTEVADQAFYGCSQLKSINLPNATNIGSYAFYGCSSLTSVEMPNATDIGYRAFYRCSSLTSVELPNATNIGNDAFYGCFRLTSVEMPNATNIGNEAFYGCSRLTSVEMPNATNIGNEAFYGCSSLTSVEMPNATNIGSYAFYSCSRLTSVEMPACLQSLGSNAFLGCSNLTDVYCYAIVPLVTDAFTGSGQNATLHVPAFSVTSYMLSDSWYTFYKIVPLDETIDALTVNGDFTIVDYTGLANKVDLTLGAGGHLTVDASSTFNLGTFTQAQSPIAEDRWNSSIGAYIYSFPYGSTLLGNSAMKADEVNLSLKVRTNRWNFISFPFDVNVSDIEVADGTLWVIRKYSGADRAALTGNTWQNMTNGMTLQAGEGYILHCANEESSEVEFVFHAVNNAKKNNIFAHTDVVKPLSTYASEHAHNRSWNLVGNPYPSFYRSTSIEHNGVITVWNGSSYTAYSLLDDDYVLCPNEAFFVQCPPDATSMTFKANGRTHEYSSSNTSYAPVRKAEAMANSSRKVYNITLSNADYSDRARLVFNEQAMMDYEISCDASKFMSENQEIPQLYICDGGIRYAIDERPLGNGMIQLGARFGQTGEYTLNIPNRPNADMTILLTDHETGAEANLAEEGYTFTAQAGTNESRFTLTFGDGTTSIADIENGPSADGSTIYDMSGRQVSASQKGIYIVKQNGKIRKVVK